MEMFWWMVKEKLKKIHLISSAEKKSSLNHENRRKVLYLLNGQMFYFYWKRHGLGVLFIKHTFLHLNYTQIYGQASMI